MKVAGLIVPAQVITDPRVRLWLTCGVRPLVDDFCRSSVVSRLLSSYLSFAEQLWSDHRRQRIPSDLSMDIENAASAAAAWSCDRLTVTEARSKTQYFDAGDGIDSAFYSP